MKPEDKVLVFFIVMAFVTMPLGAWLDVYLWNDWTFEEYLSFCYYEYALWIFGMFSFWCFYKVLIRFNPKWRGKKKLYGTN